MDLHENAVFVSITADSSDSVVTLTGKTFQTGPIDNVDAATVVFDQPG